MATSRLLFSFFNIKLIKCFFFISVSRKIVQEYEYSESLDSI